MDGNPILDFDTTPNYGRIRPEHVDPAMQRLFDEGESIVASITGSSLKPTWLNTMEPLEQLWARISDAWSQVEHMCAACSTDEWRERETKWSARLAEFRDRVGQNAKLYRRCRSIRKQPRFKTLSNSRRKIVRDMIRDFRLSGVGLKGKAQKTFRKNSAALARLSSEFGRNLLKATNDFALWIEDSPDIGDFPEDILKAARADAQRRGGEGLRFTLLASSYVSFMKHCGKSALRAQMHRAYLTRASELDACEADNGPVIKQTLGLRAKQAKLLGYGNYAEMALQTRMAGSYKEVRSFLLGLAKKARKHGCREYKELCSFAAEELGIAKLMPWDIAYASEKLRERRFGYSESEVREYFTKKRAMRGLKDLLVKLFGVHLMPGDAPCCSPDAEYWELKAANGSLIGGVFIDMHGRETKRPGAWMADAVCRRGQREDLVIPVCHIVSNFAPLCDDGDCLLTIEDLATLFHEAGHAVHHLLSKVKEFSVSGINGVEWDAVEFPSQYLENYLWRKDVMLGMSGHCRTGEPLPVELYERIAASRRFQSGLRIVRQIEFALFDMEIHREAKSVREIRRTLKDVRKRIAAYKHSGYDRFYCGFSHLFDSGYAAGYYSYMWAEVLAADAYLQADAVIGKRNDYAQAGRPFRESVLEVGGSRPMMESFKELVGREPRIKPLLAHYGLN